MALGINNVHAFVCTLRRSGTRSRNAGSVEIGQFKRFHIDTHTHTNIKRDAITISCPSSSRSVGVVNKMFLSAIRRTSRWLWILEAARKCVKSGACCCFHLLCYKLLARGFKGKCECNSEMTVRCPFTHHRIYTRGLKRGGPNGAENYESVS